MPICPYCDVAYLDGETHHCEGASEDSSAPKLTFRTAWFAAVGVLMVWSIMRPSHKAEPQPNWFTVVASIGFGLWSSIWWRQNARSYVRRASRPSSWPGPKIPTDPVQGERYERQIGYMYFAVGIFLIAVGVRALVKVVLGA